MADSEPCRISCSNILTLADGHRGFSKSTAQRITEEIIESTSIKSPCSSTMSIRCRCRYLEMLSSADIDNQPQLENLNILQKNR